MLEISRKWGNLTSSGGQSAEDGPGLRHSQAFTIYAWVDGATDTQAFGIETAPTSTGPWQRIGTTLVTVSSGATPAIVQFSGPVIAFRPYIIAKTNSTTVCHFQLEGVSGA